MTTTKRFKEVHNLSDRTFTRLVNKIQSEHPGVALTERRGSRDWEILDVALFESYLKKPADESYTGFQSVPKDSVQASSSIVPSGRLSLSIIPARVENAVDIEILPPELEYGLTVRSSIQAASDLAAQRLGDGQILGAKLDVMASNTAAELDAQQLAISQQWAALEAVTIANAKARGLRLAKLRLQAMGDAESELLGKLQEMALEEAAR